MEDLTLEQIAETLHEALRGGSCVAWIGSGLSMDYPNWQSAIGTLCGECGIADFGESDPSPTAEQMMDKAQECKQANRDTYERTLGRLYGGPPGRTRLAYSWLVKAPFKAYVTTNFDPLLSEAGAVADCLGGC
jgi:hypothetical protein